MGGVIKGIGKVISAPLRGVGHALGTSGIPLLSNVGKAGEDVGNAFAGKGAFLRDIGQAGEQAAPIAGMIPGVGPLAAGAMGLGGGLLNRGVNSQGLSEGLGAGAGGALSGLLGGKLPGLGAGGGGGLGGFFGKIGHAISSPGMLGNAQGQLDLGKVLGLGSGVMNMVGANQQRKSAQNYTNANINLKNQLMSKILAPQDYNLPGQATSQTNMTTGLGSS